MKIRIGITEITKDTVTYRPKLYTTSTYLTMLVVPLANASLFLAKVQSSLLGADGRENAFVESWQPRNDHPVHQCTRIKTYWHYYTNTYQKGKAYSRRLAYFTGNFGGFTQQLHKGNEILSLLLKFTNSKYFTVRVRESQSYKRTLLIFQTPEGFHNRV